MRSRTTIDDLLGGAMQTLGWHLAARGLLPPVLLSVICVSAVSISYLMFHALAELISIVIAMTAMVVASTSRLFTRNHFIVYIAIAIGWCAGIDLVHTLVYKGMHLLPTESANPATQLWIAARFLQACALLAAPIFLRNRVRVGWLHAAFALVVGALLGAVASGVFPAAYVDGQGLTPFKIAAEYVIIGLLAASVILFWLNRALMPALLLWSMTAAVVAMMLSEFAFTRYVSVYAQANLIGHLLKIFAYWFIYVALVQMTLREPFSVMARAASSYDAVPDPTIVVLANGSIDQANQAASRFANMPAEKLIGRSHHALFHDASVAPELCSVCGKLTIAHGPFALELHCSNGRTLEYSIAPYEARGAGAWVQVVRDITGRKRLETEREALLHNLSERIKELQCLYKLSSLIEKQGLTVTELLSGTASMLPAAFQYPDRATAYVESSWGNFGEYNPEAFARMRRSIVVHGREVGSVVINYAHSAAMQENSFLPEEEQLMDTVALRLGETLENILAEAKIRRLNYLYEMLSATNRAIVHCRSHEQLLSALFDALMRHGAFPKLFIARSQSTGQPLRIIHSHGIDVDRIASLEAMLSSPQSEIHKSLDAIATGSVVQGPLVQTGQEPWDIYLQAEGIVERALMPLLMDGALWGVVALYASESHAFDEDQLRLLDEMASDMAFALDSLSSRDRRILAEQQAHISEHRFREVFESSPSPMFIISIGTGDIRAINRAMQQWLGYALEDIPTLNQWFERVYADPEVRSHLRHLWEQAVTEVRDKDVVARSPELALRCKDGSERIAIGTMSVMGDDAVLAWTDLTEIRRGERALRDSEQRFRGMIEQADFGIYIRHNGQFYYVNPCYCNMVGWSADELLGQDVLGFTLNDPDNLQRIADAWARVEAGERDVSYSVPLRRKDGSVMELGLHASPIVWDGLPAAIVLAQDITERTRAEEQIARYVKQLESSMKSTLHAVSNMVDLRDPYTAGHERRVGLIAGQIARCMGWDEMRCESLEMIGLVHDIGKIAVPAEILSKPTRLTDMEMEIIKGHPQAGYDILKDVEFTAPVAEVILQHHERMDGSGYPRGLKGDEILPEARILAVADVIESMASHRPYRAARGLDEALAEVEAGSGTLYDPVVVDAAHKLLVEEGYTLPQ